MARRARNGRDDQPRRSKRHSRGSGVRRLVGLAALLPIAGRAPVYGRLLWELVRDQRVPRGRKALLAVALGYVVLGRDLVPDDLPLIGGLDDVVVVVLAVDLFLDGVPDELLDAKLLELEIDSRTFHEDVARVRRFTPGPLRRIMRGVPGAVTFAGDAVHHWGVGPRVRAWIDKEGSSA